MYKLKVSTLMCIYCLYAFIFYRYELNTCNEAKVYNNYYYKDLVKCISTGYYYILIIVMILKIYIYMLYYNEIIRLYQISILHNYAKKILII